MNKETLYNMANEKGQKQDCTFQRFHNPKHYKHQDLHKRFSLIMKNIVGPKILDIGC